MSIISRAADTYYTYRFIRILTTPWKDLEAYDYGIVDENGKNLRKASTLTTPAEKASYTLFHRLVFNLKRLLEKLPFGKSRLASYAAGLFLLREYTGLSDAQLEKILDKLEIDVDSLDQIEESNQWFVLDNSALSPGTYKLINDAISPETGEVIGRSGTRVIVDEGTLPCGYLLGEAIYKIRHAPTKQTIYVTSKDILK